ncbi:MAG: hypothetical protein ACE5OW_02420 [Candidatus Bathyarchaeia archaeon]
METGKPPRKPFLTARQVGMVAAFGGMGFAWRALGLVIPLTPPYVLDIRETVIMLAAFAGGPYVGIASGFLMGLPSAIPVVDTWYYPLMALVLCTVTKTAWNLVKGGKSALAYVLLIVVIAVAEAIAMLLAALQISEYGLGIVSFWPFLVASFVGGTYVVYVLQEVIPLIICIRLFPAFMEPRWLWSGGEAVE